MPPPTTPQTQADAYDLDDSGYTTPALPPAAVPATPPVGSELPPAVPSPPPPAPQPRDEIGRFAKHSPLAVQLAKDLGIPDDDIESYGPGELGAAVRSLAHRQQAQARESIAQANAIRTSFEQQRQQPANPAAQEPTPGTPAPQMAAAGGVPGLEKFKEGLDPDFYSFMESMARRIGALEQRHQAFEQREVARANETAGEILDRRFAERPDIWGKGGRTALKRGTREWERRSAFVTLLRDRKLPGSLSEQYDVLFDLMYGEGQPVAPAAPSVPPAAPAADRNGIDPAVWDRAALARPTQRQSSEEPAGVSRAERAVAEFQRNNVGTNGVSTQTESDDFL